MTSSPTFEERSDPLFELPPEEFTAARNALAKRLKADGDKAAAAEVTKLRRPTVTAWALNQVARSRPDLIDALLGAGDAVRQAVNEAVRGDRSRLRAAETAVREAVGSAVEGAQSLLGDLGRSIPDSAAQRMAATLSSAVRDRTVAAQLRGGRLEADHEVATFGPDLEPMPEPAPIEAGPAAASAAAAAPAVAGLDEPAPDEPSPDGSAPDEPELVAERRIRQAALVDEAERLAEQARRLEAEAIRLASDADEADRAAAAAQRAADDARNVAAVAADRAASASRTAEAASEAVAVDAD